MHCPDGHLALLMRPLPAPLSERLPESSLWESQGLSTVPSAGIEHFLPAFAVSIYLLSSESTPDTRLGLCFLLEFP